MKWHVIAFGLALALAAPAARAACSVDAGAAADVVALVNAARKEQRLAAFVPDGQLTAAAERQACDIAATGVMSHTGSDGSDVSRRARAAGYCFRRLAENVAMGQGTAARVVADWLASSGHRANALDRRTTQIGAAMAGEGRTRAWVIVLGRPCG